MHSASIFVLSCTLCLSYFIPTALAQTVAVGGVSYPNRHENAYDDLLAVTGHTTGGKLSPLCGLRSVHHNSYEDRIFKWGYCPILHSSNQPVTSFYPLSMTNYDAQWERICPDNHVLVSVASAHHNSYEDRRFVFGCMRFDRTRKTNCHWEPYYNDYDREIDNACSSGYVFDGVRSTHHNSYEDRIYSFRCCQLVTA